MAPHTPSPWFVIKCHTHPSKQRVATLSHAFEKREIWSASDVASYEVDANAKLIAAAPDMFEALKAVAAYTGETDLHAPMGGVMLLVREAIAKAEGR